MARDALPPLLKGLGTTALLAAAVAAFVIAHTDAVKQPSTRQTVETSHPLTADLNSLASEIHDLREEVAQKDIAEEVLENPSFEWLSALGTGIIASSFYVEWYIRKSKKGQKTG